MKKELKMDNIESIDGYTFEEFVGGSDKVFEMYQGVDEFKDMGRLLAKDSGDFATNVKGATFNAERQAAAIKNSNEYAQAKADAQRVTDSQKK